MRRIASLIAAIALLGLFAAPVAAASPPANDEVAGAIVIPTDTTLPADFTENTAGATANATDGGCSGPGDQATVWYAYTPPISGTFAVDASASDYLVGVNIYTGTPGNLVLVACGSPITAVNFPETTTFYLMFAEVDGGSAGGNLAFTVENLPPPPTIHLSISPTGSADPKAGTVTIRGTVDCEFPSAATTGGIVPDATPPGGSFAEVDVSVSQRVGRIATIQGSGAVILTSCSTATPWSITVLPTSGLFKPGRVSVSGFAVACDLFGQCGFDELSTTVRVRNR